MTTMRSMGKAMLFLVLAQVIWSCDGSLEPVTPTAAAGPAPSIIAISPNRGSTGGATPATMTGAGFRSGVSVSVGGLTVDARLGDGDNAGTTIYLTMPAHAAGTVDVIVTNPRGLPAMLAGGYTYAPPQSFDFNGNWWGFGNEGQDIPILFTIRDNILVSVSCDAYATMTFSPPVAVSNGEFSYSRDDGVAVSGRIVSDSAAVGTLNLAPCTATIWSANK